LQNASGMMGIRNHDSVEDDLNVLVAVFQPGWTGIIPDRFLAWTWFDSFTLAHMSVCLSFLCHAYSLYSKTRFCRHTFTMGAACLRVMTRTPHLGRDKSGPYAP